MLQAGGQRLRLALFRAEVHRTHWFLLSVWPASPARVAGFAFMPGRMQRPCQERMGRVTPQSGGPRRAEIVQLRRFLRVQAPNRRAIASRAGMVLRRMGKAGPKFAASPASVIAAAPLGP